MDRRFLIRYRSYSFQIVLLLYCYWSRCIHISPVLALQVIVRVTNIIVIIIMISSFSIAICTDVTKIIRVRVITHITSISITLTDVFLFDNGFILAKTLWFSIFHSKLHSQFSYYFIKSIYFLVLLSELSCKVLSYYCRVLYLLFQKTVFFF